jgi:glycerate kinase
MRILIASSGFKESLGPEEVAEAIARGVLRALPDAVVFKVPMVDGGEGFTRGLVAATEGRLVDVTVTGPLGTPVRTQYGFLGGRETRTAVLDMASAAGLRLVPRNARDPRKTTTFGVGELIKAALDEGAERVLVGLGDSGTSDGGAGAAQALGVRLLDAQGAEIVRGGQGLIDLARIDLRQRHPRLGEVTLDVVCNTHNLLCGPDGAASTFAPQKGASPEMVEQLTAAFDQYAEVIERDLGLNVREMPGGGASGGLGAGLYALLGGKLFPRYDIVMQYLEFDKLLEQADLVLTAEGSLDFQTPRGKIPAEVAGRAKEHGLPVIALAGTIGRGAEINFEHGIDAFMSILQKPCTLAEAIEDGAALLERGSEQAMRTVMVGVGIQAKRTPGRS